ncbi:hypothetical protein BGZ72_008692, partial [Mortierella alpina]
MKPYRQHRQQSVHSTLSKSRLKQHQNRGRQRLQRRSYVQRQRRKGKQRQQHRRRQQHRKNKQSYSDGCVATGLFCGSKLYGCSFGLEALYECGAVGENPKLILVDAKECLGGRQGSRALRLASSTFENVAVDKCISQCACLTEGLYCGSTFAPECNFHGLFRCGNSGEEPILVNDCKEGGGCTVNAGDDSCNIDICTCPSPGYAPVCGSQLPKACQDTRLNTIYWCPGGSGTRPEVLEICKPGTLCQPKPIPDGAICGSDTCNCTGNNAICSNTFPSECQLERNAIYKCTEEGTPELVVRCDATEVCVTTAGGSICVVPDCKCPGNGTVCGEVFPLSCRLKKTALFKCIQGQDPVLHKDCDPMACADSRVLFAETVAIFEMLAVSDQCADLCTCQGEDVICGKTFPAECRLDASTLYRCDGKGARPVEVAKCERGKCLINAGADGCSEIPSNCTCDGGYPTCGSELVSRCPSADIALNAVYFCPNGSGTTPEVQK